MLRLKCCSINRDECNPLAAILNFFAACLIVGAVFNEWLILEGPDDEFNENPTYSSNVVNALNGEYAVSNCTTIGPQLFLLPAKFTMVRRNNSNHIFYHYDDMTFMDCINPTIADLFYLITAFCFVIMSVSTFAILIHSMTPPFPFFTYLRLISALEIIGVVIALTLLLTSIAKAQVEELQRNVEENKVVRCGLSVFMAIGSIVLTMNAVVVSQLRQRQVRLTRRVENKRLICNRPLRSRRDVQNEYNHQPIAELEHYLLEPGLRHSESSGTVSTACIEDLSPSMELEEHETNNV